MLKILNTAATGLQAQQTAMEVTSNNLANVNTVGFKSHGLNLKISCTTP